tara:strand:- start:443 stop:802 length:360 start_codon:yes stop_codon:yes gene_type:complete
MQNQFRDSLFSKLNRVQGQIAVLDHENDELMAQEEFLSSSYVVPENWPEGAEYKGRGQWAYRDASIFAVPRKKVPGGNQEFYFLAVTDIGETMFKTMHEAAIFLMGVAQGAAEAAALSA